MKPPDPNDPRGLALMLLSVFLFAANTLLLRALSLHLPAADGWTGILYRGAVGMLIVAALYWKRATTTGVLAGLAAGMATAVFFVLNPSLRPLQIHEGILGLVVNIVVLITVSLVTRAQTDDHASAFVG